MKLDHSHEHNRYISLLEDYGNYKTPEEKERERKAKEPTEEEKEIKILEEKIKGINKEIRLTKFNALRERERKEKEIKIKLKVPFLKDLKYALSNKKNNRMGNYNYYIFLRTDYGQDQYREYPDTTVIYVDYLTDTDFNVINCAFKTFFKEYNKIFNTYDCINYKKIKELGKLYL